MLKLTPSGNAFHLPERWLERCRILVIGCGGSGSEVVDALSRLHFVLKALGHPGLSITLQDGASVRAANCGRQRFLPADIGKSKAEVLAARYGFLMGMNIKAVPRDCTKTSINDMANHFDLVISAVDKAAFRVKLCKAYSARRTDCMLADMGNGAADGQVVFGHLGIPRDDAPRLPHVLDLFPAIRKVDDSKNGPSCSVEEAIRSQNLGVNRFMADTVVFSILSPLFTQGKINTHGAFIDMSKPSVAPIRIDPGVWASLGYTAPSKVAA